MFSKLQYISQGENEQTQLDNIRAALEAGCNWIQLRYKNQDEVAVYALAVAVKVLCDRYKAVFIVNDFVAVAREVDADGVHVGLTDTAVETARKQLGAGKIIGGTANTLADVAQRIREGCDYLGLGPFRFTTTKEKLNPVLGLDGYQEIMNALTTKGLSVPVYAIGGIRAEDAAAILSTGVHGIAVSGLITEALDKKELVTQLLHL
jgi:thiamine-phosphate pyrophosphorylase